MSPDGRRLAFATDLVGGATALFAITTLVLALLTDWDGARAPAPAAASPFAIAF